MTENKTGGVCLYTARSTFKLCPSQRYSFEDKEIRLNLAPQHFPQRFQ